jgi:transcriptional regulator GlxA family with amidase domain
MASGMRELHAILALPGSSLLSVAAASEALRVGNAQLGGRALAVTVLGRESRAVPCAGGESLLTDSLLGEDQTLASLYVVASAPPLAGDAPWCRELLRRVGLAIDRRGGVIGGIGCGAAWWAQAGLLDGYRCCVQALHAAETARRWPLAIVSAAHHVHDRNRWSCTDGTAALELLIRWFGTHHGEAQRLRLQAHFGLERLRGEHEHQAAPVAARAGGSAKLAEAVALMQANLGEPLSTEDIAQLVGVSRRQLERLFKQHLDTLPSRWYLEQRLERARRLLLESSQSILQIGLACGFASGAHFSTAYRAFFGHTPRDERQSRAAAWRGGNPEPAKERT